MGRPGALSSARLDESVRELLPLLAWPLSAAFVVLAAVFAALLGRPDALVLAPLALVSALLAGAAPWARRIPGKETGHALLAGIVLLTVVNATAFIALRQSQQASAYVMLAVVASGACLVQARWFAGTVSAILALWAVGAILAGDGRWPSHALGLLAATALAALANRLRRRTAARLLAAEDAAEDATVRDPLTGAANRRGLALLATQVLETARRQGDAVHCIFLRISEGDEQVLVAVADALAESTRATDIVARWEERDFCVVGPGPGMPPAVLEERVRGRLRTPLAEASPGPPRVTAGGAVLAPWDDGALETLLQNAAAQLRTWESVRPPSRGGTTSPHRRSSEQSEPG